MKTTSRKYWYGMVVASICFVFLACTENRQAESTDPGVQSTRQVANLDGKIIEVPETVTRVVCLFGSAYEKVALLGAEDKIIMCSDFHKTADGWPWFPKLVKRLEEVPPIEGVPWEPNVEEMLKLDPDVVFFWSDPQPLKAMLDAGIPVVYPTDRVGKYVSDTKTFLRIYAQALGPEEVEAAERYDAYFDEKLSRVTSITSTIPQERRPRVYFAKGKTLTTSGKSSFIPELVDLAGGNCVHKDLEGGFGRENITLEQLLLWDPQFIIIDHSSAAEAGSGDPEQFIAGMVNDPRFKDIAAVKSKQLFISPSGAHYWDASCELILQVMWLAKLFHPEEFEDLDIASEMKEYYRLFFGVEFTDREIDRMLRHLPPEGT